MRRRIRAFVNLVLRAVGLEVVSSKGLRELRSFRERQLQPSVRRTRLPAGAGEYLHKENPRLVELTNRYRACSTPATDHSFWSRRHVESQIDLRYFRSDGAFIWQDRQGYSDAHTLLAAYCIRDIDRLGLMDTLAEDDLFGAYVTELGGERLVSRDLLDSIAEIYFLLDTVGPAGLAGARVLDIGAGYGRLAHRLATALADIKAVYCVDAVPEATFVSEYYLRFRGVDTTAAVIALDEIEALLARERVDVAVNIHSFSECTAAAVEWWIKLLREHDVPRLMIAPNPGRDRAAKLLTTEADGSHLDFQGIIESAGYRLAERRPKYPDPAVQKHGPFPTFHHLFEL